MKPTARIPVEAIVRAEELSRAIGQCEGSITAAFSDVEQQLARLQLGVEASVQIETGQTLSYTRHPNRGYRLSVTLEDGKARPIGNCPRRVRFLAAQALVRLVDTLLIEAENERAAGLAGAVSVVQVLGTLATIETLRNAEGAGR